MPQGQRAIDEAAEEAGRDPKEIRRVYNAAGRIGPGERDPLDGPVSRWVEDLASYTVDLGMDSFVF